MPNTLNLNYYICSGLIIQSELVKGVKVSNLPKLPEEELCLVIMTLEFFILN